MQSKGHLTAGSQLVGLAKCLRLQFVVRAVRRIKVLIIQAEREAEKVGWPAGGKVAKIFSAYDTFPCLERSGGLELPAPLHLARVAALARCVCAGTGGSCWQRNK